MKYLLLFLPLFLIPNSSFASTDFRISQEVDYVYDSTGRSTVTHRFTLTNKSSFSYAASYQLKLRGLASSPQNLASTDTVGPLKTSLLPMPPNSYQITVDFPRPVVGKNQSLDFKLTYNSDPAKHNGQIWELTLPRLVSAETVDSYRLNLTVPDSFGKPAFISPLPAESQKSTYSFVRDQLIDTPVIASFGQLQNYAFTLKYHLSNSLPRSAASSISLPPDTSYQRVVYSSLEPRPSAVTVDPDGNWLATYTLKPNSQLDITASGQARLLSQPNSSFSQNFSPVLQPDKYWPAENADLKDLAQSLKTPAAIYAFVVKHLTYDYSRLTPQSATIRRGALDAFANPAKSLCTDFSDLFVTLARAAGIPAREVQGFAYSTDPHLQPLSLVTDVLHSWAQYWDSSRNVWVSVDPTWGKTTGADHFSQFDFSHFAFVIHGQSSSLPLPPTAVDVKFSPYTELSAPPLDISWVRPAQFFPLFPIRTTLRVINNQPWALYRLPMELGDTSSLTAVLPPFGTAYLPVIIKSSLWPSFQPRYYTASVGAHRVTYNIGARYFLAWHITLGLIVSLIVITTGFIAYRTWSLHLQKPGRKYPVHGQGQQP